MPDSLLKVEGLQAWYGESHILHGVDFDIGGGELVTLLGRNGAGKTTTLKSIMGIVEKRSGSVRFENGETVGKPSDAIARLGLAYCPEERGIFATLNVEENLLLPPAVKPGGMSLAEIYRLFPNLQERRRSQGTKLSGGEQQMLAIGRILRTGANLLLLDEPTEGLAPVIVQRIGEVIRQLKARGFTILLVEQNFHFAATVADRHYVMEDGRVVDMIAAADVERSIDKLQAYLGFERGFSKHGTGRTRTGQRRLLRHAEPRARGDLRHVERHQLHARRAVHDGRLRRLAAADPARRAVLGVADPVAADRRPVRRGDRAADAEAHLPPRPSLRLPADLRARPDHRRPVPVEVGSGGAPYPAPIRGGTDLGFMVMPTYRLFVSSPPSWSASPPGTPSSARGSAPICARPPRTPRWCAPSASTCRA